MQKDLISKHPGNLTTFSHRQYVSVLLPLVMAVLFMVGFASLILTNHQGRNSIGELAVIGVFACLASATIAFPAVLKLYDRYREK